jgi:hypothetical protein
MRYIPTIFSFVTSAMAAAVPLPDGLPFPVGEIGWQGSPVPGGPVVEVWGQSFEVCIASHSPSSNLHKLYP